MQTSSEPQMQTIFSYVSTRLNPERSEIRLLTILPSRFIADQVCCNIRRVSLHDKPNYEALSYTWGDSGAFDLPTMTSLEPGQILLEGTPFQVTSNLNEALHFFRLETETRDLWVDAVCINQADIQEKNEQVSQMRFIYQSAARVLIWLGTDVLHTNEALDFIDNFDRYVVNHLDPDIQASPGIWKAPKGMVQVREGGQEPLRRGRLVLQFITERTWWSRMWVIQELALARGDPLVYCGRASLPWSRFEAWAIWEADARSHPWGGGTQMHTMALIRKGQLENPAGERLFTLLRQSMRHFNATDPRDKIYALLGLATEEDREAIQVNYAKPVLDLYIEVIKHIISAEQKLQIIGCMDSSLRPGLPSWAPEFNPGEYSMTRWLTPYSLSDKYYAARETKPIVQFSISDDGKQILAAEGLYYGIVEKVLEISLRGSEMGSIGSELVDLVAMVVNSVTEERREKGEELLEEIWRTCITDIGHEGEFPASSDFGIMFGVLLGLWELPSDWVDPLDQTGQYLELDENELAAIKIKNFTKPFREAVQYFTVGRKFFIDSHGRLCLGPSTVQKGDSIVVLLGGHVPYILQKDDNRYCLVGEAFVDLLMHGAWVEGAGAEDPRLRQTYTIF